jgi:hypothetical protein
VWDTECLASNQTHLHQRAVTESLRRTVTRSQFVNVTLLLGLVSFFDFIIEANERPLKEVDNTFIDLIKSSEDKELPLTLYNIKNHSIR